MLSQPGSSEVLLQVIWSYGPGCLRGQTSSEQEAVLLSGMLRHQGLGLYD